ncbi:MAG: shikimate dehydrogenase [Firmicutes bacterium]|nr:shikimate dehydrogenase [Bacillota bacterium]
MEMQHSLGLYAVFGSPIAHSLSPELHNAAFHQLQMNHLYFKAEVRPVDLLQKMSAFRQLGGQGLNLTRPLKELVVPYLSQKTAWVKQTGAANTVVWTAKGWSGDNTDVQALMRYLPQAPGRDRALVIGTGGAARASAVAAGMKGYHITALSRHPRRIAWADDVIGWEQWPLCAKQYAVVINASPLGQCREDSWPAMPDFVPRTFVVDWVYRPVRTALIQAAVDRHCAVVDGWTLLKAQARIAWQLWFGFEAPGFVMDSPAPWEEKG